MACGGAAGSSPWAGWPPELACHFTDVAIAGLVTFFVVWLAFALIYRWPRTRLSDERIDAALTRLAWPGYRLRRRWLGRESGPAPSV